MSPGLIESATSLPINDVNYGRVRASYWSAAPTIKNIVSRMRYIKKEPHLVLESMRWGVWEWTVVRSSRKQGIRELGVLWGKAIPDTLGGTSHGQHESVTPFD
jgi:hypothetical protein